MTDECGCFLPEQSCPNCRELTEKIYGREFNMVEYKGYETEIYAHATKFCTTHVCAKCWGELVIKPAENQMWRVICPDHEGAGYVTRYFAEEQRKISGDDLSEVKKVLIKAGVIKDPYEGKTTDDLIADLGF